MARSMQVMVVVVTVVLGIIGDMFSASASQTVDVRIQARQLADGRIEFALDVDEQRLLPQQRYFPAQATVDRWLVSSPVLIGATLLSGRSDDGITARITAKLLVSGKVEFGVQVDLAGQWSDRLLPDLRFFPVDARTGRWLRSSPIDLLRAQVYKGFGEEHPECIRILNALVPSNASDHVDTRDLYVHIEPSMLGLKRALSRDLTERELYLAAPQRFRLHEAINRLAAFGITFNPQLTPAEGTVCPGLFVETMRYRDPAVAEWSPGLLGVLSSIDALMRIGPELNAGAALSIRP